MPVQRQWLVLVDFDWSPRLSVMRVYKAGRVYPGLTQHCRAKAGSRIREIGDHAPLPISRPLGKAVCLNMEP